MFIDKIKTFLQEIRDLKTAQDIPSTIRSYTAGITKTSTGAKFTLTITYEPGDEEPITLLNTGDRDGIYLRPFDAATQTQEIQADHPPISSQGIYIAVTSNRPITDITG